MNTQTKRAAYIYQMFRKNFEEAKIHELKGEEKINAFLKCIDYEEADEFVRKMLRLVEKENIKILKSPYFLGKLESEVSYYKFTEKKKDAFRNWRHCQEVRNAVGKPTGMLDIIKVFQMVK